MKKIFSILTAIATLFAVSCSSEYDDTAVWDELGKHNERISKLETLCGQMNTNISSLQAIVTALQNNDYVTGVAPITQNGVEIGYTISFSKSGSITIYHGKDGRDGVNGTDGKDGINGSDGINGTNGIDGTTPIIGVKQDTDGIYYWTVNGEWLLNDRGEKVKAVGSDGKNGTNGEDGVDGENGSDGITPQLKIENDYWYISYDNGASWTQIGKATSSESSSCMIKDVIEIETAVIFTLADGSTITISKSGNSAPNNNIIQFVDQNAKLLCVFYFDTDDDGELSYAEAAAVTELKPGAFSYSPIIFFDEFQYFTGLEKIEDEAFYDCLSLKHITLPQGVKIIGDSAFENCDGLPNITITDSVTEIGGNAFCDCYSLTNINIPNSVTSIGKCAFAFCDRITNVTISGSVTVMGDAVFESCNSLVSVTIGNGVTEIGYYTFADCTSLTSVFCERTTPPTANFEESSYWQAFSYNASDRKIYVPRESVNLYKAADGWKEYADAIEPYDF